MSAYRMSKDVTERYTSFEELAIAHGLKPVGKKQTKDKEKLMKQRTDFCSRNLCPGCRKPMTYDNTKLNGLSVMICRNPECKGIAHEEVNQETGEKRVWYSPAFKVLDKRSSEIADNIFAECD